MTNTKLIKYILISIYFIIVIGIEFAYRKPLFDHSVEAELRWQEKASKSTLDFFKCITHFGSVSIIVPMAFIVFFFFPLNKSYVFFSVLVTTIYFDNLLKIIYSNPRPFWINNKLKTSCETGFGNPSGHAFTSSAIYLSFWNCVTDFEFFKKGKKGIATRIGLLLFFIGLIIAIVLSRLYLAVHSINQIIHGSLLGLGVYLVYFVVLDIFHSENFPEFITNKISIIIHSCIFFVLFIVALLCYLFIESNVTSMYKEMLQNLCPEIKLYHYFYDEGFYAMLILMFLVGLHYGMLILFKYVNSHYPGKESVIVNWWKHATVPKFLIRIVLIIPFLLTLLLFIFVPSDNYDYIALIYTFKFALPYLLTGLLISSAYFVTCIKLKLIKIEEEYTKKNEVDQENKEMSNLPNPSEIILAKGSKKEKISIVP